MGISFGERVTGLFVAGAVAVVAASCAAVEQGARPDGGGGMSAAGGLSSGGRGGAPDAVAASPGSAPSWPADGIGGPMGGPAPPVVTPAPAPVSPSAPAPAPRAESPSATTTTAPVLTVPAWLPPGPDSPDADGVPDPHSVYDRLRTPDRCAEALRTIPAEPETDEWRVLRALAHACLAVQGKSGSWEEATREHTALAGRAATCKGRAAYAVLGGLLEFHRLHPTATVRLPAAPEGEAAACDYGIAAVDAGEDGAARPGEFVAVELRGTFADHAELLRHGGVSVGGVDVEGPLTALSEAGDRLVLSVAVPAVPADPATPVEVRVRYGGSEAVLQDAFTIAAVPASDEPSPTPPVESAPPE
ncbi:hypothetical protein ACLGIH_27615 [Streptomyces sp. HMX87]|uniref:hypothetical protein n=1 Tax=Streptomyces sp. HMX87 TaxID=3390849 RepID=UPI003A86BAF5